MTAGMEMGPHMPPAEADPRDCRHKRRCSVSRDTPFSPLSVKDAMALVFRQAFPAGHARDDGPHNAGGVSLFYKILWRLIK